MARASRTIARAAALSLLVLALQGSNCRVKSDTSDGSSEEDGGTRTSLLVPVLDPFGMPTGGLIPVDLSEIERLPTHGR